MEKYIGQNWMIMDVNGEMFVKKGMGKYLNILRIWYYNNLKFVI